MIKALTLIGCVVKVVITMNVKCDPIIGSVFSYAYTRGSCYFIIDDLRNRDVAKQLCRTLYPGSQLAVLPDYGLLQTEIRPQMTATQTSLVYHWSHVSGHQTSLDNEFAGNWIPITETEITTRWGQDPNHYVNDDFLIVHSGQYALGDSAETNARVPVCQKRMTQQTFQSVNKKIGVGAELEPDRVLPTRAGCLKECTLSFACLSFSWISSNSTCRLHYVTTLDTKLSMVLTDNQNDRYFEAID